MHYRLTVLWIFIIWVFVGITESRPQNEPHLDRGSWKPFIPSIPERIPPQPSVDQHNSRYTTNKKYIYEKNDNFQQLSFNNTLKLFFNSFKNNNNTFNERTKNILHKLITNYTQFTKNHNSTFTNLRFFERIRSLMTNNKNDITIVNNFLQNNLPDLIQAENSTQKLTKTIDIKPKSNKPKIWPNTDILSDDSLLYYMNYTNLFNRKPNLRRKNNTTNICTKPKRNCNTQNKVKPTMTVPTKNHFTPQLNTNKKKTQTPSISTKAVPLLVTTKLTRPLKDIISATEVPSPITVTSQNGINIDTGNPYTSRPNKKPNGKCPTIYITALTTVHGNNTILSREECSDLNIVIDSQIHNNNLIKDGRPSSVSATPLQASETTNQNQVVDDLVAVDSQVDSAVASLPQSDTALAPAADAATSSTTNNFNIRPPLPRPPLNQNGGDTEDNIQADESLVTTMIDSFTTPSTWLDTLNPLLGILLTPLSVIAIGGLSLIALIFPYSLPSLLISRSARKYPKIDQTRHDYDGSHEPINGWYWHDGYKTWSNRPPKNDEFDRRILDESIDSYFLRPYRYQIRRGRIK